MLTLYFTPGASSMAVHIALHEIGVPFEGRPISLRKREQRTPEYLSINPEGKVPTLLIDGRPLTEVAAILFYLAKRYPESGSAARWRRGSRGSRHLVDVLPCRDDPPGTPARDRARDRRVRDRRAQAGEPRVGIGALLDRGYPPFSALLALCQFSQTAAGKLSQSFRTLRAHDEPARGAADVRDRSSDWIRTASLKRDDDSKTKTLERGRTT
jgi:hypothetical protein